MGIHFLDPLDSQPKPTGKPWGFLIAIPHNKTAHLPNSAYIPNISPSKARRLTILPFLGLGPRAKGLGFRT